MKQKIHYERVATLRTTLQAQSNIGYKAMILNLTGIGLEGIEHEVVQRVGHMNFDEIELRVKLTRRSSDGAMPALTVEAIAIVEDGTPLPLP